MTAEQVSSVQVPRGEDKRDMAFPPALMEKIRDDPVEMQPAARVMATTLLYEQYKESASYTPAQKLALSQELSRLGGLEPKKQEQQSVGGGVTISINIPTLDGSAPQTLTIDQASNTATEAPVFSLPIQHPEFEVVDV